MSMLDFLEQNRQTGTTTALARCIESNGGYLIVGNMSQAHIIIDQYPKLKNHVFSIRQLSSEVCRGLPKDKVFFDTTSIFEIMANQNNLIKLIDKVLKKLKLGGLDFSDKFNKWRNL